MKRVRQPALTTAIPHFAFLPCLVWVFCGLAGTQLLLADDPAASAERGKNTLAYFAPRATSVGKSTDDSTAANDSLPPRLFPLIDSDKQVQQVGFSTLWTGVPRSRDQQLGATIYDELQTIRWDPAFNQKSKPSLFGTTPSATPGIQQAGHQETLPAPTEVESSGADLAATTGPAGLPHQSFNFWATDDIWLQFDGLIRGYYHNDQRIEWSGVEATFGAEGILRPLVYIREGDFHISAEAELFLNQPYGNSLFSNPLSQPYRSNFDIDPFQIFQMFVQVRYEDFYFRIGKSRTPFGRYYAPMFTNALLDAPFIRTEIIDWTETGLFLRYAPGPWCFDVAITNGEENLDTNSSKAIMGRVGFNFLENLAIGISGKFQDGISSEEQKRHHSYYGMDFMYGWGRFLFYGELLYDEHGFRRDFFALTADPNNLGMRSLYGRDVYNGGPPATGVGYYVALGYRGDRNLIDISYGDYFPEEVGDPAHDEPIQRTVAKWEFLITRNLQSFAVGLIENDRPFVTGLNRGNWAFFSGCQFTF